MRGAADRRRTPPAGPLRGWLAIFAGALAIVGGATDGVRPILVDRVSGDDVTAVLAGLAGIVLVALGVATLWRTRRTTGGGGSSAARASALAVLVLVALVVLPTGDRDRRDAQGALARRRCRPRPALPRRRLTTSDGLRLHAWYVPSRNGAAVIAFPGRSQPVPHARMLIRHGYGVLMLDRRGEGASDGDYNAFGWAGEPDLRAAHRVPAPAAGRRSGADRRARALGRR